MKKQLFGMFAAAGLVAGIASAATIALTHHEEMKFGPNESAGDINKLGELYAGSPEPDRQRKGFECFQESVNRGSAGAMINLAHDYELGEGTWKDLKRAANLYAEGIEKMVAEDKKWEKCQNGMTYDSQSGTTTPQEWLSMALGESQDSMDYKNKATESLNRIDPKKALELYERLGLDEEKRKLLNSGE